MYISIKEIQYRAAVEMEVMLKTANSKPNMTIMSGLAWRRTVLTEYSRRYVLNNIDIPRDVASRV